MYMMRFDLRAPGRAPVERSALHRAVIEMSAWADEQACTAIVVSEHHASDDGYLSTPFMLAAAIARRDGQHADRRRCGTAPPLRSRPPRRGDPHTRSPQPRSRRSSCSASATGRRNTSCSASTTRRRGRIADEKLPHLLELLREAGAGGASARVTPPPFTSPMPMLAWGGRSKRRRGEPAGTASASSARPTCPASRTPTARPRSRPATNRACASSRMRTHR